MPLVTTDAVVLHAFAYLENSRIIRLATRDAGLQSVLARGARASTRRFGPGVDLFASGSAQLDLRPGRELQHLVGFDLVSARVPLSGSLERFAAASALAELALRFCPVDEPVGSFEVLIGALDNLADAAPERARDVGLAGAWHFVASLGFAPVLDRCCSCQRAMGELDEASFSSHEGGVACTDCQAHLPRGRSLPVEARRALRAWTVGGTFAEESPAMRRAHLRLLREFLASHVNDGRPLRALESWERGVPFAGAAP